jgi:hypothetical protein
VWERERALLVGVESEECSEGGREWEERKRRSEVASEEESVEEEEGERERDLQREREGSEEGERKRGREVTTSRLG